MATTAAGIAEYYESCEIDYRLLWGLDNSLALHYGFWMPGVRTLSEALRRQNEWLAARVGIQSSDTVLDAGCGVGGSAIYLAGARGCRATGVSLSPKQIATARSNARASGVADRLSFETRDYTRTGFADASYSVVWAIESVCHAPSKADFLAEAYRLLAPGGRLVIADGFNARAANDYQESEERLMRGWLEPWAVPQLAEAASFANAMQSAGFGEIDSQDVTEWIRPSSRLLATRARLAFLPAHILRWLRIRNKLQHDNYRAASVQWQALKRKLWTYCVFTARKPA